MDLRIARASGDDALSNRMTMLDLTLPLLPTPLEFVADPLLESFGVRLWMKRDDLTKSHIMGNKWRKLKYNLLEAKRQNHDTLATFGGAYSNHIYATAAAGKLFGFKTFGFIRGEAHEPLNPVLEFALSCGMRLIYLDRDRYREKNSAAMEVFVFQECGRSYLLPEGGTNVLAIKGCEEVIGEIDIEFDIICCACGTGGTFAGVARSLLPGQSALGFSVLKGDFMRDEVAGWLDEKALSGSWALNQDYHFGGYAKSQPQLKLFIEEFTRQTNIPLDPVYTGKMMYGIYDLAQRQHFKPGTKIIAVHSGGYMPNLRQVFAVM